MRKKDQYVVDEIDATARALARRSQGKLFKCLNPRGKPRFYRCETDGLLYRLPAWKLALLERRGFLKAPTSRVISYRVLYKNLP